MEIEEKKKEEEKKENMKVALFRMFDYSKIIIPFYLILWLILYIITHPEIAVVLYMTHFFV